MSILQAFETFANKHLCKKGTFLLGFSGGPDSTALFHLLLHYQIPFAAAHIDHCWRQESQLEAAELEEKCKKYSIPFHLRTLDPPTYSKNLEDIGRQERLKFFRELCQNFHYHGVVLGHHANDQAETVLKRIFEGASLPCLRGLKPVHEIEGCTLFRPLLKVAKQEILRWIEEKKESIILDKTNEDARFLRGRLRSELLPTLSQVFGKEITKSLCRLGNSALELSEFIETVLEAYHEVMQFEPASGTLDLSQRYPKTLFEKKVVVKHFFDRQKISLPAAVLETIIYHLDVSTSKKILTVGTMQVTLHKKRIVVTPKPLKN